MDKKFTKQLDYIDRDYFLDNPKDLIFTYLFELGYPQSTSVFYDIQTISRIFRKFDDSKGRFKSCDEENKSLRNIIIYSGNNHTLNINYFLSELPTLRLLSEPILGEIWQTYFEEMDTKKVSPKLSFGRFRRFRRYNGSELQFPTNFDYFGYNEKIINKLKQETNVRNYLQIENRMKEKQFQLQSVYPPQNQTNAQMINPMIAFKNHNRNKNSIQKKEQQQSVGPKTVNPMKKKQQQQKRQQIKGFGVGRAGYAPTLPIASEILFELSNRELSKEQVQQINSILAQKTEDDALLKIGGSQAFGSKYRTFEDFLQSTQRNQMYER